MIKFKTFLTISIVLIYLILIGLVVKNLKEDFMCFQRKSACLRFCSDDTENYSDEFLLQEFYKSESGKGLEYNNVNIYRGYPLCGGMEFSYPNDNITSENRPYSFYYYIKGSVNIKNEEYDFRRYCLEKSEYVIDGWKVMICNQDEQIHKVIHFVAILISILLFGLMLWAHIHLKELQDFHGKCSISLLANQILTYILIAFIELFNFYNIYDVQEFLNVILQLSVIHTLLWISVMVIHSLLTFIHYKNRTTATFDFSTYAVYVVATNVLCGIILLFFEYKQKGLNASLFIVSIINVIFVIITIFNVFALSRDSTSSSQARFQYERKYFWITVKFALIFLVTWAAKFLETKSSFDFKLSIAADLMMLLAAVTITLLLLVRRNIKTLIFDRYREIKNVEKETN